MFAIPILGLAAPVPWWLRVLAASGFAMTLLCVVLSVFPIITVPNPWLFTIRLSTAVLGVNALGAIIYAVQRRRSP